MADKDVRLLVHNPAELATEYVGWAERIRRDPGVPWGVKGIDERVIPLRPGELAGIVARPGNGKTSLMAYLARREAARIMQEGKEDREAVVYCTWESSAEEIENFFIADDKINATDVAWGRGDLDYIKRKMVKRARLPIWTIGHGISRAGKPVPRMTVSAVLGALESMEADYNVKPTLMLFDYLQIIPLERGGGDRVAQVTEAPVRIKELCQRIGAAGVAGVQAGREVDNRQEKIPEMADCQWGSSIEQTMDKLFSLWRPVRNFPPGFAMDTKQWGIVQVTDHLMMMRMLKQRGDAGRHTWCLYFEPHTLKLEELYMEEMPQ